MTEIVEMKWEKNIILKGKIKVITGLHIGGGNDSVKIGGTDNPVAKTLMVKDGKTFEIPYIPGSSIKGKMRRVLFNYLSTTQNEEYNNAIKDLFGTASKENDSGTISRMVFRDCYPTKETLDLFRNNELTEVKAENWISEDMKATPRFIERIRPFTEFDFECVISIYKGDDESVFLYLFEEGIKLIQQSYLGGNGTRGYGKILVEYNINNRKEKYLKDYEKEAKL